MHKSTNLEGFNLGAKKINTRSRIPRPLRDRSADRPVRLLGALSDRSDWCRLRGDGLAAATHRRPLRLEPDAANEVPERFPAATLWQFRLASLGGQAIMWASLGVLFGVAADRLVNARQPSLRSEMA